ncbi:MAG: hypothetical protein HY525_17920 [Betaproteobacteria bacterium]|nr:hypothetical protein [Betaproteobacteria bacterium]
MRLAACRTYRSNRLLKAKPADNPDENPPEAAEYEKEQGEFAYPSSSSAIFLAPVLH